MAVLPTVRRLPEWNNHPDVFAARCQCVSLGFKALCEGKPAATPCELFSPHHFKPHVIFDLSWSGYRFTFKLTILPHTPAHHSDTLADFYAKFQFIIIKDRI